MEGGLSYEALEVEGCCGGKNGDSASAAAAARLLQSRHAPSGQTAWPRPGPRLTAPPGLPPPQTRTTPPRRRYPITPRQHEPRVHSTTSPRQPFLGSLTLSAPPRPSPQQQ